MRGKKKQVNIYLRAGIWAAVAEILVRAVSFLSTPVFSRILPVDVYGEVKTFESWLNLLAPILSLGLFTNIEIAQYQFKEKFKKYVSTIMFLIVLVHGVVFCAAMLLRDPLCRILGFTPAMLIVAILYCCFYSCILCQMRTQRILLQYKRTAALSMLCTVPSLLISIACCLAAGKQGAENLLDIRIVSFYAPIILLGAVLTIGFCLQQRSLVNLDYWKYAVRVSVPLIMYQISLQILTQSDRIMIKQMVGAEQAAIFSMGTTVIYIVEILHKGFESAWIPWLYRQLDEKRFSVVKKAIGLLLAGFGVIFVYLMLLGREVILILGGTRYLDARTLLAPMLGGVIFQFLMLSLADIEKFYKKERYVGSISIAIAALNLCLNYYGILYFGYQAAAYTTMISYAVAVIAHLALIRIKIGEFKLPGLGYFLLCAMICALMIAIIAFGNTALWLRILVLLGVSLALLIICFIGWKEYEKNAKKRNLQ